MSEEQARRLVAMLTEKQKRDLLLMLTIMQDNRFFKEGEQMA